MTTQNTTPTGSYKVIVEFPTFGASSTNAGFTPESITLTVPDGSDCLKVVRDHLLAKTPYRFSERIFIRLAPEYANTHFVTVELNAGNGSWQKIPFTANVRDANFATCFVYDIIAEAAGRINFTKDTEATNLRYVQDGFARVYYAPLSTLPAAPKEVVKEVIKEVVKEVVKADPTAVKIQNEDLRKTIASFVEWFDKERPASPSNILSTGALETSVVVWLMGELSKFIELPNEYRANNIVRVMLGLKPYAAARKAQADKAAAQAKK